MRPGIFNNFILMIVQRMIFVQVVEAIGNRTSTSQVTFECCYIEELFIDSNDYEDAQCAEIDCWASQLTDNSRLRLYEIFNRFRTNVAKGTCSRCKRKKYVDIFELNYHWHLEYLAIYYHFENNCPLQMRHTKLRGRKFLPRLDNYYRMGHFYIDRYKAFEFVAESFIVDSEETQSDHLEKLESYLNDPDGNFLDQFDALYGSALYFGCSITVRNNVTQGTTGVGEKLSGQRVLYLSCVFAAKVAFVSVIGHRTTNLTCQGTERGAVVWRNTNLCKLDDYEPFGKWQEYPCQTFYNIDVSSFRRCNATPTKEWQAVEPPLQNIDQIRIHFKDGDTMLVEFEATNTDEVKFQIPSHPPTPDISSSHNVIRIKPDLLKDPYERKFCNILILFYLILLSCLCLTFSLVLKYRFEKMEFSNR